MFVAEFDKLIMAEAGAFLIVYWIWLVFWRLGPNVKTSFQQKAPPKTKKNSIDSR
jgi:hypothetical protein